MIQKFVVELKLAQKEDAQKIQKQIVALVQTELSEKIEQVIKKIDTPSTIFIPKIELNLGNISGENFISKFKNLFIKQFKKELLNQISIAENKTKKHSFTTTSELKSFNEFDDLSQIANADFFALKKMLLLGYLPWWFTEDDFDLQRVIMKYMRKSPREFQRFLFSNNPNEDKIKKLRIVNLLTTKKFITFFEKIVLSPNFKKKTAPYYLYNTILKQENSQTKKLLAKTFLEFSGVAKQKQSQNFLNLLLKSSNVLPAQSKRNVLLLLQEKLKEKELLEEAEQVSDAINNLNVSEDKSHFLQKNRSDAKGISTQYSELLSEYLTVNHKITTSNFVKLNNLIDSILQPFSLEFAEKITSQYKFLNPKSAKEIVKEFNKIETIVNKIDVGLILKKSTREVAAKNILSLLQESLKDRELLEKSKIDPKAVSQLHISEYKKSFSLEFSKKIADQYKLLKQKSTKEIFKEFHKIERIVNKIDVELIPEKSARETIVQDIKKIKAIIQLEKTQLEKADKIKKQIEKIPKQNLLFEQEVVNTKQLSLALFSYDFIFNLISSFFITGVLPLYAEKLYRAVKTAKKLKTDSDLVAFLVLFLNEKFSSAFTKDFIILLTNQQFGFGEFPKFTTSFVNKILEICFQDNLSRFIKLNTQISSLLKTDLPLNTSTYFAAEFYLLNYKFVVDSLKNDNFEAIIENKLKTTLEGENKVDNKKTAENFTDFITSGILKPDIAKSKNTDFEKLFTLENLEFFQTLFAKERNRVSFIYLFTEQTIVAFFKTFFKEQLIFINNAWQELNLLLSKTKISDIQKKEFGNTLYISLLELISAKKRASENELLQRFFNVYKSFVQRFIKNISFHDFFEAAKKQIVSARIPLYKNFRPQIGAVFIQNNYTSAALFTDAQIYFTHLLFFLETGNLHWSCPFTRTEISTFIVNLKSIPEEIKIQLFKLLQTTFALKRLFSLLTKPSVIQFLQLLNYPKNIDIQTVISENKLENQQELNLLFPELDKQDLFEEIMKQKVDWINEPIEQDKIYVKNTGLVILCNFTSFLFKRTKLIERKGKKHDFIDANARQRAVHLLQYLVYGKKKYKEQDLVLNKIICGMELRMPIDMSIRLTENEIKEAELLLKSVISHWKILGTISFEGFREAFLQRNGMITFKNKTYSIKAEQKAIDYLITKIPWTFQTIKLSWTDYLISVDWNA